MDRGLACVLLLMLGSAACSGHGHSPGASAAAALPAITTGAPQSQSVAPPARPPPCLAGQLEGRGGRQREVGTTHGDIELENLAAAPCRLDGLPDVTLVAAGRPLRVDKRSAPVDEGYYAAATVPSDPARRVDLVVRWVNWCQGNPGPLTAIVVLPHDGGTLRVALNGPPDYNDVPPCLAPNQPSTFLVLGYTAI